MTEEQKQRNIQLAVALESGKYTQTKLRLRDNSGFCCLGVACDLFREITGKGEWHSDNTFVLGSLVNEKMPPPEVGEFFGWDILESNPPVFYEYDGAAEANDKGVSFTEIAYALRQLVK